MNWKKRYDTLKVGDYVKIVKVMAGRLNEQCHFEQFIGEVRPIIKIDQSEFRFPYTMKLHIPDDDGGDNSYWCKEELEKVIK